MNKNVILAIVLVVIFLGVILVIFQHNSSSSSNSSLTLNPTSSTNQLQAPGSQDALGAQAQTTQTQQQQTPAAPQVTPVPTDEYVSTNAATIKTAKGDIDIELYPNDAPKTVTNFATLAKLGYYNNLTFHRVEPGFVIQGGDPNGDGTGGVSIYGPTFADELNANTPSYQAGYKEGVVAMANRGPNTNGSQFFIMLADNALPHQYTIFGKVTNGMDVVHNIQKGDKILTIIVNPSAGSSATLTPTQ